MTVETLDDASRVCCHGQFFLAENVDTLIEALRAHPRVRLLTHHTAVDLLTPAHQGRDRRAVYDPLSCVGAYVYDQRTGKIDRCFARATVLATGGGGQCFAVTTNEARALAKALDGAGPATATKGGAIRLHYTFDAPGPSRQVEISFDPFLPHGEVTCSLCG